MTASLKRAFAASVGIGLAMVAIEAAEPWQVVTVNRASFEGTLKEGTEFELRIESQEPKEASATYAGVTGKPRSVVSDIMLKLGGKKVSFPDTSFNDLVNPLLQTVSLTSQSSGEVKLRFTGGEGDGSYEVEYLIQSGRLAERRLGSFETDPKGERARVVKTDTF